MPFDFVDLISILRFDNGICERLLNLSKNLRKTRKLSTKELSPLLDILI